MHHFLVALHLFILCMQPFLCLMEDFLSVRAIILMCSRLWNFLPGNGCFNLRIPIITCRTTCLNSHFHHPISVYYLLPYCQNSWWKSTDQNFLTRSCTKEGYEQMTKYLHIYVQPTVHYMQVCKVFGLILIGYWPRVHSRKYEGYMILQDRKLASMLPYNQIKAVFCRQLASTTPVYFSKLISLQASIHSYMLLFSWFSDESIMPSQQEWLSQHVYFFFLHRSSHCWTDWLMTSSISLSPPSEPSSSPWLYTVQPSRWCKLNS